MRIAIDLQGIQSEGSSKRGIGRYSFDIISNIIELYPQYDFILVVNASLIDLRAKFKNLLLLDNVIYYEWFAPCPLNFISNNETTKEVAIYLRSFSLSCIHADIFLITSFFEGFTDNCLVEYDKNILKSKVVSIFYDLIPLLNPDQYLDSNPEFSSFYKAKLLALTKLDGLIAISDSSAKEATRYLEFDSKYVFNISSACNTSFFNIDQKNIIKKETNVKNISPFILYAGAFDPRKNVINLLQAYSLLPFTITSKYKLVLAGKIAPVEKELIFMWIKNFNINPLNIILTDYISDNYLADLYRNCALFVFPSTHEGFGLPILEAMSCGAPVIGSNTTSIPEIIHIKEAMFDPTNVNSIMELIEKSLLDPAFRKILISNSYTQSRKFSWINSAHLACKAFDVILSKSTLTNCSLKWSRLNDLNHINFNFVLNKIRDLLALKKDTDNQFYIQVSSCLDKNLSQANLLARSISDNNDLTWRVEGPFDSNYSLAILNRLFAKSMTRFINNLSLHVTEGPGDYEPDKAFLKKYKSIFSIYKKSLNDTHMPDVISRNLYPPRVSDLKSKYNILHSYGWEESEFPSHWVDEFNSYLQGISVMSIQVKKILIDNGVYQPIRVSGLGLDHLDKSIAVDNLKLCAKTFKILHISSCFPRKGVDVLLKAYGNTFSCNDDVTLIIKTFKNPHNNVDDLLNKLRDKNSLFPHVIVIYDEFDDEELKSLYLQSDVLVAPSRGEGFGLPIGEAMKLGLPVITTGWGGQMDFCNQNNSWLIDYSFVKSDSHFNLNSSYWAEPSLDHLSFLLKEIYSLDPNQIKQRTIIAKDSLSKRTWDNVAIQNKYLITERLSKYDNPIFKIGCISTWNSRCGIASYTKNLLKYFPEKVTVFSPLDESKTDDLNGKCIASWSLFSNKEDYRLLIDKIISSNISSLIIQFNYSFYNFEGFTHLLKYLNKKGIKLVLIMHSTIDPNNDSRKKLIDLVDALKICERILVHSIDDLNRLKLIGLTNNVSLFPHGILDFLPKKISLYDQLNRQFNFNNTFKIASYGFCLPNKGFDQLIRAVYILKRNNVKIRLDIFSAIYSQNYYSVYEDLVKLINDLELANFITINNTYMKDTESLEILSKYDCLVFPYQESNESSSASVRHGIATGRPILVTPSPIFNDVLDLVTIFDGFTADDIALGIQSWISNFKSNYMIDQDLRIKLVESRLFSKVSKRLFNMLKSLEINSSIDYLFHSE